MKALINFPFKHIKLWLAAALVLSLASCKDDEGNGGGDSYLSTNEITATHSFNESPCPQLLGVVLVSCSKNHNADNCAVDSAYFVNDGHPFVWGVFDNNYGADLHFGSPKALSISFNCRTADSFSQDFEVQFFKDGAAVTTEILSVDLNYIR